jgi:hypothetical protein
MMIYEARMSEWIRSLLDLILIGVVAAGLVQAVRLIRHLRELKQSRAEMERFVRDFNATVLRAENGIRTLKQTARENGDDLEKLVGKAGLIRDELQFIVESADHLAERLTSAASVAPRPDALRPAEPARSETPSAAVTPMPARKAEAAAPASSASPAPLSRAEKELMQALQKMN